MSNDRVWLAMVYPFYGGHRLIAICDSRDKAIELCNEHEYSASGLGLEFDADNSAYGNNKNIRYQAFEVPMNNQIYHNDFGAF